MRGAIFRTVLVLASAALARGAAEEPAASPPAERPADLPAPKAAGRMPKAELPESSGIVKSPKHPGVFWTMNDSGNAPQVIAIDGKGQVLRVAAVPGAKNLDWEEISADEQGRLVVADFGDNARGRKQCTLYRLPEPDPAKPGETLAAELVQAFAFTYPKEIGPQDAEAMIVRAGFAYVFTKEPDRTRCLRIPLPDAPPKEPVVAEYVGETDRIGVVTGAGLSADGKHLALLTYGRILTIALPAPFEQTQAEGKTLPRPFEGKLRARAAFLGQCEGICWDGDDLLITSEAAKVLVEGRDVWRIEKAK
ncbi:MAG: hypothetical protein KIS92_23965 [Planctomycetota bacterium]|nr:hypothetical protein [Planctomycetota bacterium]